MKYSIFKYIILLYAVIMSFSSCVDLLDQPSRVDLPASYFWKTIDDANYALNGAISDIRYLFSRDYYFDGMGDNVRVRGNVLNSNKKGYAGGWAYVGSYEITPIDYGTKWDNMFEYCFGGIHKTNYVIDGVERMIANEDKLQNKEKLEEILAEAKLLRSLVYFRLISMYGDVPYIDSRVYSDKEVANLFRTPIAKIIPKLEEDLEYAYQKLPEKTDGVTQGRMTKPAALALRGKIRLYWACWNDFGWPELSTFKPDAEEAQKAYKAAASDFKKVIDNPRLKLFRDGLPGEIDKLGKAEKLPNYYYLFTPIANGDSEFILAFNFGGTGTGQSEELMRDFAGRSLEYSQCWLNPRFELANRYQSIETGDFCEPLEPVNPSEPDARTRKNSAINPQSYANRDYRMKATIMWDYEQCKGIYSLKETGWVPYIYKTWAQKVIIDGQEYTTYETDGTNTGYVFRKFVRNYAGQGRSEGDFNWPVIRLADVYLMYAEAVNAADIAGERPNAIEMVNRVRRRGNLPDLAPEKTATKEAFFSAIEQERIVELVAEGHRGFDIRRWRAIERVWKPMGDPDGVTLRDTHGNSAGHYFQNQNNRTYERCYIFRIPPAERDRNPNLTQNTPYL